MQLPRHAARVARPRRRPDLRARRLRRPASRRGAPADERLRGHRQTRVSGARPCRRRRRTPRQDRRLALPDGRDAFAARLLLAARRRTQPRRAVLHLARRHDRRPAVRRAVAGRRARRARAPAARRRTTPRASTRRSRRSMRTRTSRCGCSIPFANRGLRASATTSTDFARLNRRMHNKSFTADNQVTIVGGRNIGDEYFDARQRRRLRRPGRASPSGPWCAKSRRSSTRTGTARPPTRSRA